MTNATKTAKLVRRETIAVNDEDGQLILVPTSVYRVGGQYSIADNTGTDWKLVCCYGGCEEVSGWIHPETDLDSEFQIVCCDTGEKLTANGWNLEIDFLS